MKSACTDGFSNFWMSIIIVIAVVFVVAGLSIDIAGWLVLSKEAPPMLIIIGFLCGMLLACVDSDEHVSSRQLQALLYVFLGVVPLVSAYAASKSEVGGIWKHCIAFCGAYGLLITALFAGALAVWVHELSENPVLMHGRDGFGARK